MKTLRLLVMVLVSAAATLLIGWGSRATYQARDNDTALLRLSWRMRGERIQQCRDRTQAELAALPVHMRTPQICESRPIPYRVILAIDEGPADTTVVLPAGAKHDRPVYVLRDSTMLPGRHRIRVVFERTDSAATARFLDQSIRFQPGHIELITMSDDARALIHRSAAH